VLGREGTVEVNSDEADFLALRGEVVDGLADGLGHRAHGDDDAVGILCAVIVKQAVLATSDFADFVHVVLDDGGHSGVVVVARLAVLEEDVGVLGGATGNGLVGIHGAVAESCQCVLVDEGSEVVLLKRLDLLNLVRSAETVEEVDKGHATLDGAEVSDGSEVHHLLYRALAKHCEARLTGSHHVLMVAEDTQRVRSQGTRRNMEDAGEEFASNLVHVRNHEE